VVNTSPLLRAGDEGEPVRDLQQRLVAAGMAVGVNGRYDLPTTDAVRGFQERRGLRVDGICGPETWGALIESGFELGDRLLYLCQPMLRGDDVVELQQRLNALGFDAGREDGILGPDTERAIGAFQRDAGLATDKVTGPATLAALNRVGSLAAGSVAAVREREALRTEARRIEGLRVFVAGDFGLATLTGAVATGLKRRGALVALDTSGEAASFVTTSANRFEAELFVALTNGAEPGARCAYFANQTFRSEGGFWLARRLTDELRGVLPAVEEPIGRTYRLLRETRMAAVVCELAGRDDAAAMAAVTAASPQLARVIVSGIRRGVEEPVDPAG
jgi:N-acetylmuramoyl-L-alanine amidase